MTLGQSTRPEDDAIELQLRDQSGAISKVINTWKQYSYNSHFLTPTDGWSFTLGDEVVKQSILEGIFVGQRVTLSINGHTQGDGYVDKIQINGNRSSGVSVSVEGRDRFAPVVDGNIDPQNVRFNSSQSLWDVLYAVFSPYGWTVQATIGPDAQYIVSNEANRNVITGEAQGVPATKLSKPIKSYQLHQLKPYPNEGNFAFAARVAQRFGLWIWLSADGRQVIIGKPDFGQAKKYDIRHKTGAAGSLNNVLDYHVERHAGEMPTVIVATGFGGGGEYPRGGLKCVFPNILTGYTALGAVRPEVQAIINANGDGKIVLPSTESLQYLNTRALTGVSTNFFNSQHRPMYLHDDESKTLEQLENFVRREMSLRQRSALTAVYTLEGHSHNGRPWCVDTIVNVDDDVCGIHGNMWVMSRTFTKDRMSGTRTRVELILPYTMEF